MSGEVGANQLLLQRIKVGMYVLIANMMIRFQVVRTMLRLHKFNTVICCYVSKNNNRFYNIRIFSNKIITATGISELSMMLAALKAYTIRIRTDFFKTNHKLFGFN
jgi:hypothetical protein